MTTQVLWLASLTALKQANPSDITALPLAICRLPQSATDLVLKPSTTVIRILIGCPSLFRATAATNGVLPAAPDPFATTALATPVDIIELNDAADGLLVIGLFHGFAATCLSIRAVSYLTPNWRFSSIADKPVFGL